MGNSAVDVPALVVGAFAALGIALTLEWALRGEQYRRGWLAAGALFAALTTLGVVDLLVAPPPRETPFFSLVLGVGLPVLGTLALHRGTRRVRPWIRIPIATTVAFVLLMGGFLLAAAAARWLPV